MVTGLGWLAATSAVLLLLGRLPRFTVLRRLTLWLAATGGAAVAAAVLDRAAPASRWLEWTEIALVFALTFLVARVVLVALEWVLEHRVQSGLPHLARQVIALVVYLAAATILLQHVVGFPVGTVVATSAVITIVIGLALQQTLGNLFAGVGLAWEGRLETGTWLMFEDQLVRVEELGWRSLTLRTRLGERLIVPNATVAESRLRLLGLGRGPVAVPIRVGVAYGVPPDLAKRVLLEVATGMPDVLPRPAPKILVVEWADSAVVYECRLWTQRHQLRNELVDTFLTNAHAALARSGMEIPFPQRTVHFAAAAEDPDTLRRRTSAFERSTLFAGLPEDAARSLAGRSRLRRFAPGGPVVREGEESRALYVVAAGGAAVERGGSRIGAVAEGEVFGEMAFLTGEPRAATVRADGPLEVAEVDAGALRAVLEDHPGLVDELAGRMASRQAALQAAGRADTDAAPRRGLFGILRSNLLRFVGMGGGEESRPGG